MILGRQAAKVELAVCVLHGAPGLPAGAVAWIPADPSFCARACTHAHTLLPLPSSAHSSLAHFWVSPSKSIEVYAFTYASKCAPTIAGRNRRVNLALAPGQKLYLATAPGASDPDMMADEEPQAARRGARCPPYKPAEINGEGHRFLICANGGPGAELKMDGLVFRNAVRT
jgi:hypothetical protein